MAGEQAGFVAFGVATGDRCRTQRSCPATSHLDSCEGLAVLTVELDDADRQGWLQAVLRHRQARFDRTNMSLSI